LNVDIEGIIYITLLALGVVLLCVLLGAIIYDVKYSLLSSKIKKQGEEFLSSQPHVTILVYLTNSAALDVAKCLRSIVENSYKAYDIVIVENGSANKADRSQIKTLLRDSFTKSPIYYYASRRKRSMTSAYKEAYKRSERGELALLITANDTLSPRVITKLINLHSLRPDIPCFLLPEISAGLTVESAYADIARASRGMKYKIRALIHTDIKSTLAPGMMLRKYELQKRKVLHVQYMYVSDAPIVKSSYVKGMQFVPVTRIDVMATVVVLLIVAACLWLAIISDVDQPFIIAWAIASIWSVLAIIQADTISLKKRIHLLSISILSLYFYIVFSLASLFFSSWAAIKKL
jgi:glycosyltransferase involved in cell wall biosynthesis